MHSNIKYHQGQNIISRETGGLYTITSSSDYVTLYQGKDGNGTINTDGIEREFIVVEKFMEDDASCEEDNDNLMKMMFEKIAAMARASDDGLSYINGGCILTDKNNRILSYGIAKRPDGSAPIISAEIDALIQCNEVQNIHTAYVHRMPTVTGITMLLTTPCRRIVCIDKASAGEYEMLLWKKNRGPSSLIFPEDDQNA